MAKKIRYAIVGLGHIAQSAVLPAFEHASENSELVAFVSDSRHKTDELKEFYGVADWWRYHEFDECLKSGKIDAVYIALPNDMHKAFAVRAARAGIHVLCEKPMAPNERDCWEMIEAARSNGVKLMVAYRLHFEPANLKAIEIVKSGQIGNPRYFTSSFSMQVNSGNIRTQGAHHGGPLFDLGVYCINAARYLFEDEPVEVVSVAGTTRDQRFAEIEEAIAVSLLFPKGRLATFICSMGASSAGWYQVVGTEGNLIVSPAYHYELERNLVLTNGSKTTPSRFEKCDQFGPELSYFSDCILNNREIESSGYEGLADIHIISAVFEAALAGRRITLDPLPKRQRPDVGQLMQRPPVAQPPLVDVQPPSL